MPGHDIIVVGASSGGVETLKQIVAALPPDLPAAMFIVLHRPAIGPNLLAEILQRVSPLAVADAVDGQAITQGHIYIGPPDRHLLIEQERIRLSRGPKENRFRPAIDPLFRSAALAYGPRVIGVVLTGNLDDGTAGLWTIKDRGGIAIVQDPQEAMYPSMPSSALANVEVDYCLRLDEIAPTVATVSAQPVPGGAAVSENLKIETRIALADNALDAGVMKLGKLSPFTCPECHGMLLQIQEGGIRRFRCHTGHAYSLNSLLYDVTESVEESVWNALRAMDEVLLLLRHLGDQADEQGDTVAAARIAQKGYDIHQRIEILRQALHQPETPSEERSSTELDAA
jgi:two-component system, chemotaxis family, protein-glutamate methylesterase/glutaminase